MRTAFLALLLSLAPILPTHAQRSAFDIHVHLRGGEESVREYQAQSKKEGVRAEGFGAMWFGGPRQARQGDPGAIRANNDALLDLAARHPGMVPIVTVHPYDGRAALDELARVAARGARVLKIHAHTQRFDLDDPRVLALARRAGELGITVLTDNAGILPGDNEKLFNLAVQAPQTRFVFAHIGGLGFRFWNVLKLARTADGFGMDNVYFDISATVTLVADSPLESEFVWTLRNVGIDRVLLGSDYPQIGLGPTLDALERLDLTPEEKRKIRSGNAAALLRIRAPAKK